MCVLVGTSFSSKSIACPPYCTCPTSAKLSGISGCQTVCSHCQQILPVRASAVVGKQIVCSASVKSTSQLCGGLCSCGAVAAIPYKFEPAGAPPTVMKFSHTASRGAQWTARGSTIHPPSPSQKQRVSSALTQDHRPLGHRRKNPLPTRPAPAGPAPRVLTSSARPAPWQGPTPAARPS